MNEDMNKEKTMASSMVFDKPEVGRVDKPKESKYHEKTKKKSNGLWAIVGILIIALALSIFTSGFRNWSFGDDVEVTGAATDVVTDAGDLTFIILNDPECEVCDTSRVKDVTEQLFPGITMEEIDFSTEEGKEFYDKYDVQYLPAYFFTADVDQQAAYQQVAGALVKVDDLYMISPQSSGSTYDPYGEKCENGVDDNDDGLVDCDDPDCATELACMDKKAVPDVELFVMSHCPFGTQIEKGILPVLDEIGDEIDFKLRFVHYAMHAETEVYEQLNQYCIQKTQSSKLIPYLECFLQEGNGEACLDEVDINDVALEECVEETDEKYSITDNLEDQSTWLGNFPPFNIDKTLTDKYGVQGSPTLVVNSMVVETGRDPASLLKTICYGFDEMPDACDAELSAASPAPGFGLEATTDSGTDATCG